MVDFSKYDDQELSFLMKSEDKKIARSAFDIIYSRYSSRIYTFCVRFLKDKDLAQDIFQDVFINFFNCVHSKENIANIGGYLQRIARNLCINTTKDYHKNTVQFEQSHLVFNESSLESKQDREMIDKALNLLPDHFREIIILKEFMNLSYDEIAESMDINRNSVGVTLHRAKQRLKEILQPYFNEVNMKEGEKYEFEQ